MECLGNAAAALAPTLCNPLSMISPSQGFTSTSSLLMASGATIPTYLLCACGSQPLRVLQWLLAFLSLALWFGAAVNDQLPAIAPAGMTR